MVRPIAVLLCVVALQGLAAETLLERPATESSSTNIAVLDLEPLGGLTPEESRTVSDRLRGELIATDSFTVLERGQMDAILREQGFQQSGACSEASCIVEVGQLLAVHKMVGGSIGRVGRSYSVNLKVIDVQSGRIERQVAEDVRCSKEQLVSFHVRQLARRMAGLEKERRPLTSRWYFWAPVGAVVVGAGVTIGVLAGGSDEGGGDGATTRLVPFDGSYQ